MNQLHPRNVGIIMRRELQSYFATPVAYVFIVIFLMLAGMFTFYFGGFYEAGSADLDTFFFYHPWLYLFLVPALSMRLWAEERKSGSIELLMTLPITLIDGVLGKFLAAWLFTGIALALTFPIWMTVNYLGSPDNGVILAAYIGSLLMAGGFLAIGSCLSAVTRNQVIAFILTVVVCFLFLVSGLAMVLEPLNAVLPQVLVDAIAGISLWTHFESIRKGVIDFRDILYYTFLIAAWLIANTIVLDANKAE
jgi:ABC-2 type transport system permease protein